MSEPENLPEESGGQKSKKAANKEAAKLRSPKVQEEAARTKSFPSLEDVDDSRNYGDVVLYELQSTADPRAGNWSAAVEGKDLTPVSGLVKERAGSEVLIRGRVHKNHRVSEKLGFLTLREKGLTVQCVAKYSRETKVGPKMITFLDKLSRESVVEVIGLVSLPKVPVTGATQEEVEIQVRKMYCTSRALSGLPLIVEDASRSEADIESSRQAGKQAVGVNQDTRLDNRVLDLRTPANQAIFRIRTHVESAFRDFLLSRNFDSIQTPKLLAGIIEGGADVFHLNYKGQPTSLAQSAQFHKQMAICSGFTRVFDVGSYFRAEDSFTNRHLCEFVVLNVEMEIHKHYSEIMDLVDELFVSMFNHLNEKCRDHLVAVGKQHPFEPLKFLPNTLRLTFAEGVQMLKEAGVMVDPLRDLDRKSEKKLGKLVLEKYKTDFFILHRYPLIARPFFTMPCGDDPSYSNSFDVFIRGQEIISGAQRIHDADLLEKRAKDCGIDVKIISSYIDSFKYGTPLHGGFGAGLDRVVMLFCGLKNIRQTSLFPRDARRLAP